MNAIQAIQRAARENGIKDWRALAAVGHAESGLNPGSIGDGGSSFGLFQLHQGGALGNMPTSKARQYLDAYRNASFAARQIKAMGIHGLTGRDAIHAFVTRFERPANPSAEVERAWQWYTQNQGKGLASTATPTPMAAPDVSTPTGGQSTAAAQSLIDANAKAFHLPTIHLPPTAPANVSFRIQPDGMDHTEIPSRNDLGSAIVAAAKNFLGVPYVWGGTSPKGFDCSGLVKYVFAKFGINTPRIAADQFNAGMKVKNPQPGDLIGFSNEKQGLHHIGIYVGNGMFIQAPHTGDVVKISKLSDRNDIAGFRRFAK